MAAHAPAKRAAMSIMEDKKWKNLLLMYENKNIWKFN